MDKLILRPAESCLKLYPKGYIVRIGGTHTILTGDMHRTRISFSPLTHTFLHLLANSLILINQRLLPLSIIQNFIEITSLALIFGEENSKKISSLWSAQDVQIFVLTIETGITQPFTTSLIFNMSCNKLNLILTSKEQPILFSFLFQKIQKIHTVLCERFYFTQKLKNKILQNTAYQQVQKIVFSTSMVHLKKVQSEIKQGFLCNQSLQIGIDSYEGALQKIITSLERFGFLDIQIIKNAIEQTNFALLQSIKITLDGEDITNKVKNGSINLYGDTILSDCTLEIATNFPVHGSSFEVIVEGIPFSFLVEELEYDKKEHLQKIWGRCVSANLYDPYAIKQEYEFKNKMASEIISEVCVGYIIDWQIDDWLVPYYKKKGAYPLDVAKEIVESIGAVVRATPDGILHIVWPYFFDTPDVNFDLPLSLSLSKKPKKADGVKIVFGEEDAIVLEADRNELRPGEWAEIKVYCVSEYDMQCTADVYFLDKSNILEEVEETITCEEGEGRLSMPCVEIIDDGGAEIVGQSVKTAECKVVNVKYKTKYDVWKLTNHTESTAMFCSVATENSYILLEGTGQRIEEIKSPLSFNKYLAKKRAEKELIDRKGLRRVSLSVPFELDILGVQGLSVSTPFGRGVVIKNSISFTGNPLKIINNLEVLLWPH